MSASAAVSKRRVTGAAAAINGLYQLAAFARSLSGAPSYKRRLDLVDGQGRVDEAAQAGRGPLFQC